MTRLKFNRLTVYDFVRTGRFVFLTEEPIILVSDQIIEQPSKTFIVLDLQEKELRRVNTMEEAENLFLEVYPSFHKESVKYFIHEIYK